MDNLSQIVRFILLTPASSSSISIVVALADHMFRRRLREIVTVLMNVWYGIGGGGRSGGVAIVIEVNV